MAKDDRLYDSFYDLQEADSHRFLVYSPTNSYITPYSSDTHGGELITEFNQRAALNTLLKREVDLSRYADIVASAVNGFVGEDVESDKMTGETSKNGPGLNSFEQSALHDKANWKITSYATGTRDEDDFHLALDGEGRITVSAGVALVYGYYVESNAEVRFEKTDAFRVDEITNVSDNEGQISTNPCMTRFIKVAVQYTSPPEARHDERLIPPLNGVYQGAAIVINNKLPYGNELLLGTITIDSNGSALLTENPYKTRMIPLDSVNGAENYDDLLSAVDDEHVYGIKFGSTDGSKEGKVTNLKDIDPWLWLASGSNLAMLLRSMSTNSEGAGKVDDKPTRGVIVSDETPYTRNDPVVDNFNCLQRVDAHQSDEFARISWHQAQVSGEIGADTIDHRALYLPYAASRLSGSSLSFTQKKPNNTNSEDKAVRKPFYSIQDYPCLWALNGTDGIVTAQQLAMLELMFDDYINRKSSGYARGRQYGPFLTLEDAKNWFERFKPNVDLGDYFWVINDTVEAGGTEATGSSPITEIKNIVTDYGTVSGTVTGTAKQSKLDVSVKGTVTGTMNDDKETPVEGEVTGDGQGTINATVTGTVTGTLDSFTQNVSSRYVCRYHANPSGGESALWRFAHAVMLDVEKVSTTFGDGNLGTESLPILPRSIVIIPKDSKSKPNYDDGVGHLTQEINGKQKAVGTIDYETGVLSITEVESEGIKKPDSESVVTYLVEKDMAYTVLDPQGESKSFTDTSVDKQSVLFAVESVERGFAVPATDSTFGVVKVSTGSELYDVINDPTTTRLRITERLLNFIKNGGFEDASQAQISIQPNQDLTDYAYKRFPNGVVFTMAGNASEWRAALDTTGTLAHIRGDVTLDFTKVVEDGNRSDGLLLHLEDIDFLTLKGDNTPSTDTRTSTETLMFGVNHCEVNSPFFTNIGEWKYSRFISGGNTLELDLPWMVVEKLFTETTENSLSCRFASITMGEYGISSAMLDVWIKHKGWQDFNGNIDRMWSSYGYIKFPPLFFEYKTNEEGAALTTIDTTTIQHIPDNLNLKVSGTSGVHQAWDDNAGQYVPSGNLLVNFNWEHNGNPSSATTPGGKVYLNLYMKNSSIDVMKQEFSGLRFRANVQVIRLDDNSMSQSVPYLELYEAIPTKLS